MNIRIESIGSVMHDTGSKADSMGLLEVASKECLEKSKYISHDVDVLLYTGVYRSDFLLEPAIAAILAKQLDLNAKMQDDRRTFAFDIMNGGIGFFNAIITAINFIKSGNSKTAMIATAEIENNREKEGTELLGLNEAAATIIVESTLDNEGFGEYLIKNFTEEIDDRQTELKWLEGTGVSYLENKIATDSDQKYLTCIYKTLEEYLKTTNQSLESFDVIIPPQTSHEFCEALQDGLGLEKGKLINVFDLCSADDDKDFLTSSLPFTLKEGIDQQLIKPGDKALFICAGSGIQIGCISHQF
ncbi:MAG: hypothetical protein JXR07_05050 [Reichenbachiella sp.]